MKKVLLNQRREANLLPFEPTKRLSKKESGFTLLETMFVLVIVIILFIIVPPLMHNVVRNMETKHFLTQFQEDILYAQQYAITNSIPLRFNYYSSLEEYRIREFNGTTVINRKLPEYVNLQWRNYYQFDIYSNGNLSDFGTLHFTIYDRSFSLIFNIRSGRFYWQ